MNSKKRYIASVPKHLTFLATIVSLASAFAHADGLILFSNQVLPGVNAPVDEWLQGIRADSSCLAQLLAGDLPTRLFPAGAPVPFRDVTGGVGSFRADGPRLVKTENGQPGGRSFVKVFAWSTRRGATNYAQALRQITCLATTFFAGIDPDEYEIEASTNLTVWNPVGRLEDFTVNGLLILTNKGLAQFFRVRRLGCD